MSLDGKIATSTRESQWITGEEARAYAHRLRQINDAVVVGVNTVLADDPLLTNRHGDDPQHQPVRIVLDSRLRTPATSRILTEHLPSSTLLACTDAAPQERAEELRRSGAEVLTLRARYGRVDIAALLEALAERGLQRVLVEGGGETHAAFVEARVVDRLEAVIAPLIIGGRQAPTVVAGNGFPRLADALRLRKFDVQRLGRDVLLSADVGIN